MVQRFSCITFFFPAMPITSDGERKELGVFKCCGCSSEICYPETALHPETTLHYLVRPKLLLEFDSLNSCAAVFRCNAAHSLLRQ